jgi:hypothetical protein
MKALGLLLTALFVGIISTGGAVGLAYNDLRYYFIGTLTALAIVAAITVIGCLVYISDPW